MRRVRRLSRRPVLAPLAGGLQRRRLSAKRLPVRAYLRRAENRHAGRVAMRRILEVFFAYSKPLKNQGRNSYV
jgi:hypothetical protein